MKYHFEVAIDEGLEVRCLEIEDLYKKISHASKAEVVATQELHRYFRKPPVFMHHAIPWDEPLASIRARFAFRETKIFAVNVPPAMAFALRLRIEREARFLNQTQAAERLGLQSQSAYQRLEDTQRSNPTLGTIARVLKLFPKLDLRDILNCAEPSNPADIASVR